MVKTPIHQIIINSKQKFATRSKITFMLLIFFMDFVHCKRCRKQHAMITRYMYNRAKNRESMNFHPFSIYKFCTYMCLYHVRIFKYCDIKYVTSFTSRASRIWFQPLMEFNFEHRYMKLSFIWDRKIYRSGSSQWLKWQLLIQSF